MTHRSSTRPADDPSVITRFKTYLEPSTLHSFGGTACQLWAGGKSRGGDRYSKHAFYGTFNPGGVIVGGVRAHVYAAWLAGLIPLLRVPQGMNVDHRCHQALCCNPLHLEVVLALVNQARKRNRTTIKLDKESQPTYTDTQKDTTMALAPYLSSSRTHMKMLADDLSKLPKHRRVTVAHAIVSQDLMRLGVSARILLWLFRWRSGLDNSDALLFFLHGSPRFADDLIKQTADWAIRGKDTYDSKNSVGGFCQREVDALYVLIYTNQH